MSAFETPWERWSRDPRPLQHVTEDELTRGFVTYFERTVTPTRTIPIESQDYEVPREAGRGGERILVTLRLLEGAYYVSCGDRLVRIHPVDLAANARSPRARPGGTSLEDAGSKPPPEKTAAFLAFERELGPVVSEDGGSLPPTHLPEEEETL
jgi:hypothetical protein